MYAFARFITEEIRALQAQQKKVNVLFLMRDAHLPQKACEALTGGPVGHPIRISRFAAFAASFRTKEAIYRYLSDTAFTGRFEDIARQLLLPDAIVTPLIEATKQSDSPIGEFIKMMQREDLQNIIIKQSDIYRKRLIKHLQKTIGLKRNDTLMFVDLGYSGTAQRLLEPILRDELNVTVIGRYLIELNVPGWETSRRGLIDPSWCDERSMLSLVSYIALLEQLCTSNEKSVIDYDAKGNAVHSTSGFEKSQYDKLKRVQEECIRFIHDAKAFFNHIGDSSLETWQKVALAELGRFIFLPTEKEIQYLESFEFDLNMGTHDILRVFDQNEGLSSLRKRDLFFSFMERNQKTMRTNCPAELRSAGLELVTTLMAQHRFGIDFGFREMSLRRESIPVIANYHHEVSHANVESLLTHDGYFALSIPAGNENQHTAIMFGKKYRWVQLESVEIMPTQTYLSKIESLYTEDCWSALIFKEMNNKGGKLFECLSEESAVIIPPLNKSTGKHYLVRLVFRPIVMRDLE